MEVAVTYNEGHNMKMEKNFTLNFLLTIATVKNMKNMSQLPTTVTTQLPPNQDEAASIFCIFVIRGTNEYENSLPPREQ
ncbi:unnamed protein product [Nezara viridula]|uniref:Uncharacterized protein n=1 Tax=Nezara viridula TaxID=85310 RepID=A0A9P0HJV8_NEZVI|nr:unnamed protein product [Nezara viridula]